MIFQEIKSGSNGNCYIYNDNLMLDCGISYKQVKPYMKNIKILCLSHIHGDHFNIKTIKSIIANFPLIHIICGEWLVPNLIENGIPKKNIWVLKTNTKYNLGQYTIELIPTLHDVPNCAYKIIINKTNYKIFHATDLGNLDNISAKNFNLYNIEANYQQKLLEQHRKEKDENYEFDYTYRVEEKHLSYEQAMNFLVENMGNESEYNLLHKSSYNFNEEDIK